MPRELVLGIDFGTTYSSAGVYLDGRVHLALDAGDPLIPSVVYVPRQGEPLVGKDAVQRGAHDPAATIVGLKRLLGCAYQDPHLRSLDAGVGYQIRSGPGGVALVHANDLDYAPAQLVAAVVARLRGLAERRFGGTARHAVFSIPAEATAEYRNALHRAAALAGVEAVRFVAEPVAGVLAYGLHTSPADRRVAVCDFGGGTFDCTLVDQRGTSFSPFAVGGDMFLGGNDFDDVLADALAGHVLRSAGADMRKSAVTWSELMRRSESAKRQLSHQMETRLRMKDAYVCHDAWQDLDVIVERTWIEPRWLPLADRAARVVATLLERARCAPSTISELILIGGTMMMPIVRRQVAGLFVRPPWPGGDASTAVTIGAALLAAAHARTLSAGPRLAAGNG
jgi:molecular chaperone DnaK